MNGSPNTSFIPKHSPNKIERKSSPRQLFIGTIIVRVFFFAVLVASVGVFFYERRVANALAAEVVAFQDQTKNFESDQSKLETVLSVDKRLRQANERIRNSVSMNALLAALDATTLQSVQIKSFSVTRKDDATYTAEATITTDSFNSVIYQREKFQENEVLAAIKISDVAAEVPTEDELFLGAPASVINFRAEVSIPAEKIRAVASAVGNATVRAGFVPPATPTPPPVPVVSSASPTTTAVTAATSSRIQ